MPWRAAYQDVVIAIRSSVLRKLVKVHYTGHPLYYIILYYIILYYID